MNGPKFTSLRCFSLITILMSISKFLVAHSDSYFVEFSRPASIKPIPEGTVKVYFYIIEKATGEKLVEFNFENESLRHNIE